MLKKAAVLYNSKGKGEQIIVENIGNESLKSTTSEKLLGLHIDSDFGWTSHVDMISVDLKKRIGLLRRVRQRVPKNKLIIIAEAIFNSKIRYGIFVYLTPIFDDEDLKMKKQSKHSAALQTLQNSMIRVILGISKKKHINMQHTREKLKMMSINQMAVYNTLIEAFNIVRNSASEQIQAKWIDNVEKKYTLRSSAKNDIKVPEKPKTKCSGFTYHASKLYNMLPTNIREAENMNVFKVLVKNYVWKNIPSY